MHWVLSSAKVTSDQSRNLRNKNHKEEKSLAPLPWGLMIWEGRWGHFQDVKAQQEVTMFLCVSVHLRVRPRCWLPLRLRHLTSWPGTAEQQWVAARDPDHAHPRDLVSLHLPDTPTLVPPVHPPV